MLSSYNVFMAPNLQKNPTVAIGWRSHCVQEFFYLRASQRAKLSFITEHLEVCSVL